MLVERKNNIWELTDKNNFSYWFPKVENLGIPVPMTEIVPIEKKWTKSAQVISDASYEAVKTAVEKMQSLTGNEVVFIRGSHTSNKHGWAETCYLPDIRFLRRQINNIIEFSNCADFMGIPCESIVVRQYIEMAAGFRAFNDMPVNPERRYFIKDGKVLCHHPYWIEDAILNPKGWEYASDKWQNVLAILNKETEQEMEILTGYAERVSSNLEGEWSVDFCRSKAGIWILIDMAEAERSWHPADCPRVRL